MQQRQQLSDLNAQQAAPRGDGNVPVAKGIGLGTDAASERAAILRFRLNLIIQATDIINARRLLKNLDPTDKLTPREVLISILWKAFVRARWGNGTHVTSRSSVSFPVDIRPHLIPPLEPYWMGNAEATAVAIDDTTWLQGGYNPTYIEHTANIVHASAKSVSSDPLTRSHIEVINASTSTPAPPDT